MAYYNEMLDTDRVYIGNSPITRKRLIAMKGETICINGIDVPVNAILEVDKVFNPIGFDIWEYSEPMRRSFGDKMIANDKYCKIENPYIPKEDHYYRVFIVKKGDLFGMIDEFGNTIIPIEYKKLLYTRHNLPGVVLKKDKFAFIFDILQFKRTSSIYDDITVVSQHLPCGSETDSYLKAFKNGKCGLIYKNGNEIVAPIYDDCFGSCWFMNNDEKHKYIVVTEDCKKGIINELGEIIADIKFDKIKFHYHDKHNPKDIQAIGWIGDEEFLLIDPCLETNIITRNGKVYDIPTFERYGDSYAQNEMGFSDDDIDTIFEGDPSAYWNID